MSSQLASESESRPRSGAIVLGCLLGFLGGEIAATVLVVWGAQLTHYPGGLQALTKASSPPWWSNVLSLAGLWLGFASAIYFASTRGHLAALPGQWRARASDAWFVLLGAACQGVVAIMYYPFHLKSLNRPVNHLFGGTRGLTFVVLGVLTTLVAPLVEEWFFRGVLFRALLEGLGRAVPKIATVAAILISACLFALAHGEPLQFAGLAFVGVVLAVVLYRTQRLLPSVITHVSFNAVALGALMMQRAGH